MNTAVDVAPRFDDWQDDVSQWPTNMFSTSFSHGMPMTATNFWESPRRNSEEYCASPPGQDRLQHNLGSTDHFDTSYNVDNDTPLLTSKSGLETATFVLESQLIEQRHQEASLPQVLQLQILQDSYQPRSHITSSRKRLNDSNSGYGQSFQVEEDILFDDTLTSSATTSLSKRPSQSPAETILSPTSSATSPPGGWSPDGGGGAGTVGDFNPFKTVVSGSTPPAPGRNRRNRERNRVAAHKCRQKAKQSMSDLQVRERELSKHNRSLHDQAGCLRDEILGLKHEILRHSGCDSDIIQNYIARAARDVH
ncbi:hypothetical protein GGR54DRAFT_266370 [Hypoxylon sp. NC1633]|nr:hypothetical protein GGR54DRAFT_266370 [Hypoxylon sp. NC1633]